MAKFIRKNSSSVLWCGGLICLVLAGFAIFGKQGLRRLHELHQMEQRLESRIAMLEQSNAQLARGIARLNNPEHLARVARDELGFLHPDEVVYYVGEAPAKTH